MLHNSSQERGGGICEGNSSANTKVSEEGGGRDARAEIPLQHVGKSMVRQLCQCVSDIEPGKNGEVEGKCFRICFYLLLPFHIFLTINQILWAESVLPTQ